MIKRYATKPCNIDGIDYNPGDIVPNEVADVDSLERYTRLDTNESDNRIRKGDIVPTKEEKKNARADSDFFDEAVIKGIIDRDGYNYSWGDIPLGNSKEKALEKLEELDLIQTLKDLA